MRVRLISLQDFRNIEFLRLEFVGNSQFFVGENGQGKTNILEALAYVTNLRSFRLARDVNLIRHENKGACLYYELEDECFGLDKVYITMNGEGKRRVELNNSRLSKVSEYVGRYPTVVMSCEDMEWLRGVPGSRRQFLDMTLCGVDKSYLEELRGFQKCLAERNALLKGGGEVSGLIEGYEVMMAALGGEICRKRRELVLELNELLGVYYLGMTGLEESPQIRYEADVEGDYLDILRKNRDRDRIMKSTQRGPHRDDFIFKHKNRVAKTFASEGQQRALVLALRLAQGKYFEKKLGKKPVLLADDVLGQLDPGKYERFWEMLDPEMQVIATGTVMPSMVGSGRNWEVFEVREGAISLNV